VSFRGRTARVPSGWAHLARLPSDPSEAAKRRLKVIQWYEEHGGKVRLRVATTESRLTARHFGFSPDTIRPHQALGYVTPPKFLQQWRIHQRKEVILPQKD